MSEELDAMRRLVDGYRAQLAEAIAERDLARRIAVALEQELADLDRA